MQYFRVKRPMRSVPRETGEPQAGPASRSSNSASKEFDAGGDGVNESEPKTKTSDTGEDVEGLPGSKSVARLEGDARNRGGPEGSCRTNCEGQAGREAQRQEAPPDAPGVGSTRSNCGQGTSPDRGEGGDSRAKLTQATSPARTAEPNWQTFLWAKTTCPAEEPGAGKPPAGICEGGAGQPASLPRQN